jgi:ribosomal protein S11
VNNNNNNNNNDGNIKLSFLQRAIRWEMDNARGKANYDEPEFFTTRMKKLRDMTPHEIQAMITLEKLNKLFPSDPHIERALFQSAYINEEPIVQMDEVILIEKPVQPTTVIKKEPEIIIYEAEIVEPTIIKQEPPLLSQSNLKIEKVNLETNFPKSKVKEKKIGSDFKYVMFLKPKKNNFFVSILTTSNKLVFMKNTGSLGFQGPKRTTPFALEALGKEVADFLVKSKIEGIKIFLTSRVNRAMNTVLKQFKKIWKNTHNRIPIKFDYTKVVKYPHSLPSRKKKPRRV